jgi:hypothetical protein
MLSLVSAETATVTNQNWLSSLFSGNGQAQYISGTSSINSAYNYGETINIKFNVKFTEDTSLLTNQADIVSSLLIPYNAKPISSYSIAGAQWLVLPFFKTTDGNKYSTTLWKSTTQHKKYDIVTMEVLGMSTNVIPKSYCNKLIEVNAVHYQVVNGDQVEDMITPTGTTFILKCPDVASKCAAKSLGNICTSGTLFVKQQTTIEKSDGTCQTNNDVIQHCSSGVCADSTHCQTASQYTVGQRRCSTGNKWVEVYDGTNWLSNINKDQNDWCGSNGCESGRCINPSSNVIQPVDELKIIPEQPDTSTSACEVDGSIICYDGSKVVVVKCENKVPVETGLTCGSEGASNYVACKYYQAKDLTGVCAFSMVGLLSTNGIADLFSDYMFYFLIIIAALVLIFVYNPFKKHKRRRK